MENQPIDKIQIIIHGLLAAVGGIVRVLSENKKYSYTYYFSQAVISSFAGVIVGLILKEFVDSDYIALAFSGMAGYSSSSILHILSEKLKKKLEKI